MEYLELDLWEELTSPINIILTVAIILVVKKMLEPVKSYSNPIILDAPVEKIEADMTVEELRPYDGVEKPHIFIGVNGSIYDCSTRPDFYGPKGPYGLFAGRDASRALATGDLSGDTLSTEYDDLENLTEDLKESLREWEQSYSMKYRRVGALVRTHTESADEDTATADIKSTETTTATAPTEAALNLGAEDKVVEQPSDLGNKTTTLEHEAPPVEKSTVHLPAPSPDKDETADALTAEVSAITSDTPDTKDANADDQISDKVAATFGTSAHLTTPGAGVGSPTPSVGKDWEFVEKADADSKAL